MSSYDSFTTSFKNCVNSKSEEEWESRWKQLVEEHKEAKEYIEVLYGYRQKYGGPWTRQLRTYGTHSTQRVESLNSVLFISDY